MAFFVKKTNAVDKRLQTLEAESKTLNHEIKSLSRKMRNMGAANAAAGPATPATKPAAPPVISGPTAVSGAEQAPARLGSDDLFAHAERHGQPSPTSDPGTGQDQILFYQKGAEPLHGRERFANYFMAGHFRNLRPMRQDTRILRNKAMLMLALVILALLWVYYVISH